VVRALLPIVALCGCAQPAPPPPATPPPPLAPLPRACVEALPARPASLGELVRTLRSTGAKLEERIEPCRRGTTWPIAFAIQEGGRPPIGMTLLKMEGDALLTLDPRTPDSPSVKLCARVEIAWGDSLKVRAIALADSDDERALDAGTLDRSRAELAWLEVLGRAPSPCALGRRESPGEVEPAVAALWRCVRRDLVTVTPAGCPPAPPASSAEAATDIAAIAAAASGTHRIAFPGRDAADGDLTLDGERCFHEPAPATRDVCLAVYRGAGGARWYGRGDVERTGVEGRKNYVDSYLTFQQLKKLEAERKARQK
jgi:hypothetical protein